MDALPRTLTDEIEEIGIRTITGNTDPIKAIATEQGNTHFMALDNTGLEQMAKKAGLLRKGILILAEQNKLQDPSPSSPKSPIIYNQEEFVKALLQQRPELVDKLAEASVKAQILVEVLAGSNEEEQAIQWRDVVDRVANALIQNPPKYQALKEEKEKIAETPKSAGRRSGKNYRERLQLLLKANKPQQPQKKIADYLKAEKASGLAEAVIDTYLQTTWVNNAVRALNRIQMPLGLTGKTYKLIDNLTGVADDPTYAEIIKRRNLKEQYKNHLTLLGALIQYATNEVDKNEIIERENDQYIQNLKKILTIENTPDEDAIDLVETKAKIDAIKLETDRIKNLPIGDKEKKAKLKILDEQFKNLIYPIANKVNRIFPHKNATDLTSVLDRENAICTGKTNVLMTVSIYLGINARAIDVQENITNTKAAHMCYECDLPSSARLIVDANFANRSNKKPDNTTTIIDQINANKRDSNLGMHDNNAATLDNIRSTNHTFINTKSRVLVYTITQTGQVIQTDIEELDAKSKPFQTIRVNPYTGKKEVWKADIPHPHLFTFPDIDGLTFDTSAYCCNATIGKESSDTRRFLSERLIRNSPYNADYYKKLMLIGMSDEDRMAFITEVKKFKPQIYWEALSGDHLKLEIDKGNIEKAFGILDQMAAECPIIYRDTLITNLNMIDYCLGVSIQDKETKVKYKKRMIEILFNFRDAYQKTYYSDDRYFKKLGYLLMNDKQALTDLYYDLYNNGISIFLNDPCNIQTFSDLLIDDKKYSDAIGIFNLVKITRPDLFWSSGNQHLDRTPLYQSLCFLYQKIKLNDKAIKLYREAMIHSPCFWESSHRGGYYDLIQMLNTKDTRSQAIELGIQAKTNDPNFFTPQYYYGYRQLLQIYYLEEQYEELIHIAEEADEKDPNFWTANNLRSLKSLGIAYEELGHYNEAIDVYEKIKSIDSQYLSIDYIYIYKLYKKVGRDKESTEALNGVISELEKLKKDDEKTYAKFATDLSYLYSDANNSPKAFEALIYAAENYNYFEHHKHADKLVTLAIELGEIERVKHIYDQRKINLAHILKPEIARSIELT